MSLPNQTYANHVRIPPAAQVAIVLILAVNVIVHIVQAVSIGTLTAWWQVIPALALVVLVFAMRRMSVIAQDRIIRLEMRVRLHRLLPGREAEVARLSVPQLVALRFASDAELPGLVEQVLRGELAKPDAIKRAVKDWQPDHLRV